MIIFKVLYYLCATWCRYYTSIVFFKFPERKPSDVYYHRCFSFQLQKGFLILPFVSGFMASQFLHASTRMLKNLLTFSSYRLFHVVAVSHVYSHLYIVNIHTYLQCKQSCKRIILNSFILLKLWIENFKKFICIHKNELVHVIDSKFSGDGF